MKTWAYEGHSKTGEIVSGEIKANSMLMAQVELRSRTISIIKIQAMQKDNTFWGLIKQIGKSENRKINYLLDKVDVKKLEISSKVESEKLSKKAPATKKEVYVFIRQFAVVIKSGIPLIKAFDIVIRGQENKKFANVLTEIKYSLESGVSLTNSFASYPRVFDSLFINFLAIGEQGGVLDVLLERYVEYIDKVNAVKRKIKSALSYPIIVLIIACIVIGIVLGFVVPSFEKIFANFGAKLPSATLFVIYISKLVASYWWMFLLISICMVFVFKILFKTYPVFRYKTESIILRIPLFGDLIRKSIISRWSRTLALLFSAGVPLNDSLESIAIALNNYVYGAATLVIQKNIENGMTLSAALDDTQVFPSMVNQMVSVGEESGKLELLLNSVADYYDQDVDLTIDILLSLIEPITIVILGAILGGIIVAIYLPIFNLGNVVG